MVNFDNTINLGHVLTFIGFIASAVGGYFALKVRLQNIELSNTLTNKMIDGLQAEIKKLTDVMVTMAKFEERLVALRMDVQDLKKLANSADERANRYSK